MILQIINFDELYGTETNESDRPSLKEPSESAQIDKERKNLLVAGRVRSIIKLVDLTILV